MTEPHSVRSITRILALAGAALACALAAMSTPALAAQPRPCTGSESKAIIAVVTTFSRALIRDDMVTVNRIITPELLARTRGKRIQTPIRPKTEQAALSHMLLASNAGGGPAHPVGFRFLPNRTTCLDTRPPSGSVELFYRWQKGTSLSVVELRLTAKGWRITALELSKV